MHHEDVISTDGVRSAVCHKIQLPLWCTVYCSRISFFAMDGTHDPSYTTSVPKIQCCTNTSCARDEATQPCLRHQTSYGGADDISWRKRLDRRLKTSTTIYFLLLEQVLRVRLYRTQNGRNWTFRLITLGFKAHPFEYRCFIYCSFTLNISKITRYRALKWTQDHGLFYETKPVERKEYLELIERIVPVSCLSKAS